MIDPSDAAGHTDYKALAARMGHDVLEKRILEQAALWTEGVHQGQGFFRLEKFFPIDATIRSVLRFTGMAGWGRRNFLDVQVVENEVRLQNLPAAFEGFRLLQMADLHCDLAPKLMDVVISCLDGLTYDAAVLAGDYHNRVAEEHDISLELMGRLIPALRQPRIAILGNHDFIEKVAFLESAGLTVLLNENTPIEREGSRLWICGVDDPHYFKTADLVKARRGVEAGEVSILLSHSPETFAEAESLGYDLILSGHTHGGQICLPGGFPLIKNAPIPRRFVAGAWRYGRLAGYTSRGTGACGVAARFFCPPEITIHVLRRASGH